jgi:retron-type reverse transcriptase
VSNNQRRTVYALKCDVRKFFECIDHAVLIELLEKRIHDPDTRWLVRLIVQSYEAQPGKGLPLGNVTSQLFSNVYLNEFDQYVKHVLKARQYVRYCDDFIILHSDLDYLRGIVPIIQKTLHEKLKLTLHPHKVSITKVRQGVDFLGYVVLPHATMVRTSTKKSNVS